MPLLDDYLAGDDDEGDDYMFDLGRPRTRGGARRSGRAFGRARAPMRAPGRPARAPAPASAMPQWPAPPVPGAALSPTQYASAQQLYTPIGGVPVPGPRVEPLGFPVFTFGAATGTTITQIARPQKPFKGSRLVIDVARTGATATGLVSVADLSIGARPVLVNRAQPIPAAAFAPTAFGIELLMDTATPGVDITLTLSISAAPAMTDVVVVGCTILGLTWS